MFSKSDFISLLQIFTSRFNFLGLIFFGIFIYPHLVSSLISRFKLHNSTKDKSLEHNSIHLSADLDECTHNLTLYWNEYINWGSNVSFYKVDVEDSSATIIELASGAFGTIQSSWATRVRVEDLFTLQIETIRNNLSGDDVAWLVPHQANKRIIDATARRMGVGDEKVMLNIEKYGNTTNGTIPLCLWEWEDQLNKGDNIILAAFGGGFTWGSIYLKWAYDSNK